MPGGGEHVDDDQLDEEEVVCLHLGHGRHPCHSSSRTKQVSSTTNHFPILPNSTSLRGIFTF